MSSSLTAVDLFRSVSPAAALLIAVWSFVERCLSIDVLKVLINLAALVDLAVLQISYGTVLLDPVTNK